MATEASSMPVNGNYAPHQGYGGLEHNNYAYGSNTTATQPSSQPPPTSSTPAASSTSQQSDISKDEVGWYFVEQYYMNLSRSPERLYLFYNKRSQFVSGQETDKVPVCVGQRAINDRIKELDFQDCKVRVSNVDTQASDSNIVIQVIGAISNKSHPHRKFCQTFVLGAQTNGYFVLNDIFRYLVDEEDEVEREPEPQEETEQIPAAQRGYEESVVTPATDEPQTWTSSSDPAAVENDTNQLEKEAEDKTATEPPQVEEPTVNGVEASESSVTHTEDEPAAELPEPDEPAIADSTSALQEEPEKPKDPEPTPAASPPKEPTPQPAPKPAAPKTWASLVGSTNRVATPNTPSTATSNSASTSQPRATPPSGKAVTPTSNAPAAQAPPTVQAPPTAPAAQREESSGDGSPGDEWTAVGASNNRQQSRQAPPQQEGPQNRAYIKNVHEGIDANELRSQLEKFGELTHFDIARQRSAAFVDFKTAEAYNAAVAANPQMIGGERLFVEARRARPGSGAFTPRGQFQGNRGGRGGVNQGQPRGNYQSRGGYAPRGARGGAPRGGTSAQAA